MALALCSPSALGPCSRALLFIYLCFQVAALREAPLTASPYPPPVEFSLNAGEEGAEERRHRRSVNLCGGPKLNESNGGVGRGGPGRLATHSG